MAQVDLSWIAGLGDSFLNSYDAARKRGVESSRAEKLKEIAAQYPGQLPPASVLGAGLLQAGDVSGAMAAAALAQTQAQQDWQRQHGTAQLAETARAHTMQNQLQTATLEQTKANQDLQRQLGAATLGLNIAKVRQKAGEITPSNQAAILKAEDEAESARRSMGAIQEALSLNDRAFSGIGAAARGRIAGAVPEGTPNIAPFPDREKGVNTQNLEKLVRGNILGSLKATFGSNPTEGERKVLLDLEGSIDAPADVRRQTLERALERAQERRETTERRAREMRAGTYFKTGGGAVGAETPPAAPARQYEEGKRYSSKSTGKTYVIRNGVPVAE